MVVGEGDSRGYDLASVESRLDALESECETVRVIAEAANHLTTVLDPRTLETISELQTLRAEVSSLRAEVTVVHTSLEELRTYVADVRRMAAIVWDQAAVSRRLARLEDVFMKE